MATESETNDSLFASETKEYDVTDVCFRVCCCMGSKILTMEPKEVTLETTTIFSSEKRRMPYGEIGSVENVQMCGCCHSFRSNLSPISPGCGYDAALVAEIVRELTARMKRRGDTGNIQRAEQALRIIQELMGRTSFQEAKIDAIMAKLQVPVPQQMAAAEPAARASDFAHNDYDMTSYCMKFCCCGQKLLSLDPEEVELVTTTCCSESKARSPYGELGNVQESVCCGSCESVSSNLGSLSPGCGCEKAVVEEVVQELKALMKARGDTGNIERQEQTVDLVRHLINKVTFQDYKVTAIMQQMGVPVPAAPPTQQVMGRGARCASSAGGPLRPPSQNQPSGAKE